MQYLAIIFFILFSLFAWKNFRWAVGFFIVLLPSYLIRFNIGPLPTTLLEVAFGALFLVWLLKYFRDDREMIWEEIKSKKLLFIFIGLFFISSVTAIFVSDMWYYSLGQWRAYFLEPMILFFILLGRKEEILVKDLVWFLILSSLSVSIIAVVQKITGQLYPPSLWDDELNGRAVSFFTTPNAIGLYLAPIVPLFFILPWKDKRTRNFSGVVLLILLLAILFSFSQGAWIALGVGLIVFAYLIGYKKTAIMTVLAGVVLAFSVTPIRSAVMFQDRAGQNRLELWSLSWNYFKSSPQNFIFGTGIRQFFRKIQKPVYAPEEMERLIYPHNIFLNFWTEIGLLGMISFGGILVYGFFNAFKIRKNNLIMGSVLVATLVVFIVHGLVDVPYFKNDLAFLFWIVYVLFI